MSAKEVSSRLSGRVESAEAFSLGNGHIGRGSNHDSARSAVSIPKRLRPSDLHSISQSLTDRDRQLIEVLSIVRAAAGAQLRRLLWGDTAAAGRDARRQLQKLSNLRVVARLDRRIGGVRAGSDSFCYVLDIAGSHVAGIEGSRRRPREPSMAFLAHTIAVTECYVQVAALDAAGKVELLHFETEPRRGYMKPGGVSGTLKPDAFAVLGVDDYEDRWFFEVDRATEAPSQIRRKAEAYVSYWRSGREEATFGVFPRVLWVVPGERRKTQLTAVLGSLPPETWRLFRVCTAGEFADTIATGAEEREP